jgi:hypothetical protein
MFETVTLFENKAISAEYKEETKGKFEVIFTFSSEKKRIDKNGQEQNIPHQDWIDIGVYAEDELGTEHLIYLKKHKVEQMQNTLIINVKERPTRVGVDPLHKLIDRHADDNSVLANQFVEIIDLPL